MAPTTLHSVGATKVLAAWLLVPRLLSREALESRLVKMRQVGPQRNGQEQVEALGRLLLEPAGRRQRRKVLRLLGGEI